MPSVTVGGLEIFYRETGSGEPVLLLQGLGTDHRGWGLQVAALSPWFRCITPDNRDAGRSGRAAGPYTVADMAADAAGLLDALGVERAHVVGISMGGAIAQELAISRPGRVRSLALIATYCSGDPRGTDLFQGWRLMRERFSPEEYYRATYPWVFTVGDYLRPGFIQEMVERAATDPYAQEPEAWARQMAAATAFHSEDRLDRIAAPTLLLFGDADLLTPLRFARTMQARIPQAELVVIPDAGHGLIWSHAEAVNAALLGFLLRQRAKEEG